MTDVNSRLAWTLDALLEATTMAVAAEATAEEEDVDAVAVAPGTVGAGLPASPGPDQGLGEEGGKEMIQGEEETTHEAGEMTRETVVVTDPDQEAGLNDG